MTHPPLNELLQLTRISIIKLYGDAFTERWLKWNTTVWEMMLKANKRPFFFVCGFRCTHVLTAFFCCFWFHNPKKKRGTQKRKPPKQAKGKRNLFFFSFEKLQHNNFPLAVVFLFLICFELVIFCVFFSAAPLVVVFVTCLSLHLARLRNLLFVIRFLYPHRGHYIGIGTTKGISMQLGGFVGNQLENHRGS